MGELLIQDIVASHELVVREFIPLRTVAYLQ